MFVSDREGKEVGVWSVCVIKRRLSQASMFADVCGIDLVFIMFLSLPLVSFMDELCLLDLCGSERLLALVPD